MKKQQAHSPMTLLEMKLYFYGSIAILGILLLTILFGHFTTPMLILRFRLFILCIGFLYFLGVFSYYERTSTITKADIQEKIQDIIIIINGKELRR